MKYKILRLLLFAALIAGGLVTVFPFVWMVLSSFKSNGEIEALNQTLLPQVPVLENYLNLQNNFNFLQYFFNSVFIAVVVTLLVIYTSCLCGYVLGKYEFKGKNLIFAVVMMTMMVPWSVTIIPRYTMFVKAGLQDSYLSLVIPSMVSGFGIFMMKQHMESIPNELIEAARIDGSNEFQIFHKQILPLSKNGISAIAIFQFLWVWEDYLWPYLMIDSEELSGSICTGYPLFTDQVLLAVPEKYLPARQPSPEPLTSADILENRHKNPDDPQICLQTFEHAPFLLLRRGNDTRRCADMLCRQQGFSPDIILELDQQATAYHLACYGMGITFVSDTLIRKAPAGPDTFFFRMDPVLSVRTIYFYHKKGKYVTRAMEEFLKMAKEDLS